jgi:DNA polymerase III subunit epsilon
MMAFRNGDFVAIDFETADYGRDSACAIALVRVEKNRITKRIHQLIRPPRKNFVFSDLHGITWQDVANEPRFAELWSGISKVLENVAFLAAHNASFDRSVLNACCEMSRLKVPAIPFVCTVNLARTIWNLYPTKLPMVCSHLGISLDHHNAASDAEACAKIILAARRQK